MRTHSLAFSCVPALFPAAKISFNDPPRYTAADNAAGLRTTSFGRHSREFAHDLTIARPGGSFLP